MVNREIPISGPYRDKERQDGRHWPRSKDADLMTANQRVPDPIGKLRSKREYWHRWKEKNNFPSTRRGRAMWHLNRMLEKDMEEY